MAVDRVQGGRRWVIEGHEHAEGGSSGAWEEALLGSPGRDEPWLAPSGGASVQPAGMKPSFADGTQSSWKDVTVNTSSSNWLKTLKVCATVFCGPKIS